MSAVANVGEVVEVVGRGGKTHVRPPTLAVGGLGWGGRDPLESNARLDCCLLAQ